MLAAHGIIVGLVMMAPSDLVSVNFDVRSEIPFRVNLCDLKKNKTLYRDKYIRIDELYLGGEYPLFFDGKCNFGIWFRSEIILWENGTSSEMWNEALYGGPDAGLPRDLQIDVAGELVCETPECDRPYIIGRRLYSVTRK